MVGSIIVCHNTTPPKIEMRLSTMKESPVAVATRRSIKRVFPLGSIMSKGSNNPITLHSVDDDIFVRIWSLIAETMVVTEELSRPTKEAIAMMVSERNNCPVCITAHCMLGAAASRVREKEHKDISGTSNPEDDHMRHKQALDYAGLVFDAITHQTGLKQTENPRKFSRLNDVAKAECAVVVLLFLHINRVVSVILGEEMSTAMFSMPRAAARVMEKRSVVKAMNRFMSPLLSSTFQIKHEAGLTRRLFPEEGYLGAQVPMPQHLQWVLLAGIERSDALARIHQWVKGFEKLTLIHKEIVSKSLIQFLEDWKTAPPNASISFLQSDLVLEWAEHSLPDLMEAWGDLDNPASQAIAWVLVLTTYAPNTVYQSTYWCTLVEFMGENMARLLVVWWSLRHTLNSTQC